MTELINYIYSLKHYANGFLKNEEDTEDLLHDVILKMLACDRYKDKKLSEQKAIWKVTLYNLIIDKKRLEKRKANMGDFQVLVNYETPQSIIERKQDIQVKCNQIKRLRKDDQAIILMRLNGVLFKDISCRLNKALGTVLCDFADAKKYLSGERKVPKYFNQRRATNYSVQFKKRKGMSPKQFAKMSKLEKVKALVNEGLTVKEIAGKIKHTNTATAKFLTRNNLRATYRDGVLEKARELRAKGLTIRAAAGQLGYGKHGLQKLLKKHAA